MTKEKLDELEALARDLKERNANLWTATEMEAFAPKGPQAADLLLRLLEERKRLLEAVRGINARGEPDDFIACEDAQAFAEEAA